MSGQKDFSGSSMLELFRMEVESHSASLNDGLVSLANDPASTDQKVLEGLMRASHSIKGAARIVGLQHAVAVAHAMEDCFVAAQDGKLALRADDVEVLLRGTDFLIRAGQEDNKPDDAQRQAAELVSALQKVRNTHPSVSKPAVIAVPATTSDAVVKDVPLDSLKDMSLLDLFRSEVESNSTLMTEGFSRLEHHPGDLELVAELRRAAHSIKGAARIVNAETAMEVALPIEEALSAVVDGKASMNPAKFQAMRAGLELLGRMARDAATPAGGEKEAQGRFATEVVAWQRVLKASATSPSPVPVPTSLKPVRKTIMPATRTNVSRPNINDATRAVRVNAQSLSRLMGLAGESLVEAGFLSRFEQSLRRLQEQHMELSAAVERLQGHVTSARGESYSAPLVHEVALKSVACQEMLAERMHAFEVFALRSDNLSHRLYREVIASRMRPFGDGIQAFPRMVHDLARSLGKNVRFEVIGKNADVDRDILDKLEAPLNHLLRNAVDHGIESPAERLAAGKPEQGRIVLEAVHKGGMLSVTVSDDGRGVDLERVRQKLLERKMTTPEIAARLSDAEILEFLFLPGFSTAEKITEISGRGVGLDVVQTMVQEVSGQIRITSQPGKGCTFHVLLPITLSVVNALLVDIAGEPYAFPLARIDRVLRVPHGQARTLEGRQYIALDGQAALIGLVPAQQVLELGAGDLHGDELSVVVVGTRTEHYGLAVDRVLGERKIVVRPLDGRLGKVPNISAAALMEDGSPLLIVDIEDMLHSIHTLLTGGKLQRIESGDVVQRQERKRVLVVDDSLTVREVERKLLENKGYMVDLATDGAEGWNAVRSGDFDLIITDVDMPRMNGIELVLLIRADARLSKLPVMIVSYKDREEDRLRGMEAGANYYLTKSSFQDESLLDAVVDLIGEA